ncbi:MAG: hypothetical protein G01um10143_375 [Parcubacteria group bacterium Gr01-1014_3]|nr:MAG: hypothetical protein G01um10143_375 [Parcubacteria group bacterium Gr01-1014_3]
MVKRTLDMGESVGSIPTGRTRRLVSRRKNILWVWKESNLRPLSYQDSVLPLNYTPARLKYYRCYQSQPQLATCMVLTKCLIFAIIDPSEECGLSAFF